jgi:hypothetical protein
VAGLGMSDRTLNYGPAGAGQAEPYPTRRNVPMKSPCAHISFLRSAATFSERALGLRAARRSRRCGAFSASGTSILT